MRTTVRPSKLFAATSALLVGGSILLGSMQSAQAADRVSFKDFRGQNPELARHTARRMFPGGKKTWW